MLKIETTIVPLVIGDAPERPPEDEANIAIVSHHAFCDRFIIDFLGKRVTIMAEDMRRAIQNALNHE
jgi:hypothetical protein